MTLLWRFAVAFLSTLALARLLGSSPLMWVGFVMTTAAGWFVVDSWRRFIAACRDAQ